MNREFKKKIVVINGSGGAGKDTFVNLVFTIINGEDPQHDLKYGGLKGDSDDYFENRLLVLSVSTIESILTPAKELGWDGMKNDKGRKFLSDLKKLVTEYCDRPYQYIKKRYIDDRHFDVLFIHCREPHEIKRFVDDFGAKTLLIRRPGIDVPLNDSDMGVENYEYDYIVYNSDGIEELKDKAKKFVEWLLRE